MLGAEQAEPHNYFIAPRHAWFMLRDMLTAFNLECEARHLPKCQGSLGTGMLSDNSGFAAATARDILKTFMILSLKGIYRWRKIRFPPPPPPGGGEL